MIIVIMMVQGKEVSKSQKEVAKSQKKVTQSQEAFNQSWIKEVAHVRQT